jgi:hypothetical protein
MPNCRIDGLIIEMNNPGVSWTNVKCFMLAKVGEAVAHVATNEWYTDKRTGAP